MHGINRSNTICQLTGQTVDLFYDNNNNNIQGNNGKGFLAMGVAKENICLMCK